jgi:hypothetical protein
MVPSRDSATFNSPTDHQQKLLSSLPELILVAVRFALTTRLIETDLLVRAELTAAEVPVAVAAEEQEDVVDDRMPGVGELAEALAAGGQWLPLHRVKK